MNIIHVHPDGGIDISSPYAIDPEAVDATDAALTPRVRAGIEARWHSVRTGTCTCGGKTVMLNRLQRRRMRANFHGMVEHQGRCPAMDAAVRSWVWQHRGMSQ